MTSSQGMANIPLILSLLIMVIAIPVAYSLSQRNQNIENRAAVGESCLSVGQINCFKIPCCDNLTCLSNGTGIGVCSGTGPSPTLAPKPSPTIAAGPQIPCSEISLMKTRYCSNPSAYLNSPLTLPCSEVDHLLSTFCSR